LPGTVEVTAQRSSQGAQPAARTQARTSARRPWRQDRRDTVKGHSKTAPSPLPLHTGFAASGARRPSLAGGVRDQSRMAATRNEARGAAREPDGGTPGRSDAYRGKIFCIW